MTLEQDHAADLFGLAGTFPRPGWVILDAAIDHRFTGELVFDVTPQVRVNFDRGRIYMAERETDPSLGARLVDAGALNAAQLEHGSMRIGDSEHLGRLFERVPSVDRQATMLTTELMNETCITWLAAQRVHGVTSTPYRHHSTGIHRWNRPADAIDLSPGDPLPAPPPTEAPVEIAPPESVFAEFSNDTDPIIHWNEPSWLDERASAHDRTDDQQPTVDTGAGTVLTADWADRLEQHGLPPIGSDPLAPKTGLPPITVEPVDRFEVIWPSGEIDDEFPTTRPGDPDADRDRAGPTARVVGTATVAPEPATTDEQGLWDFESTGPSFAPIDDRDETVGLTGPVDRDEPTTGSPSDPSTVDDTTPTDEVTLSMRRAVATIETGSLAARRRLSDTSMHDSSRGTDLAVPGRVATRSESSIWAAGHPATESSPSVFDEPSPTSLTEGDDRPAVTNDSSDEPTTRSEPERVSALRRLIGGLRRR